MIWVAYGLIFATGAGMQFYAWRHDEMEECGHKAVFIMVIAVTLAVMHLTVL